MAPKTDRGKWNKAWQDDGRKSNKKAMQRLYEGEENPFLDSNWSED